jgi:hypothetical protein
MRPETQDFWRQGRQKETLTTFLFCLAGQERRLLSADQDHRHKKTFFYLSKKA